MRVLEIVVLFIINFGEANDCAHTNIYLITSRTIQNRGYGIIHILLYWPMEDREYRKKYCGPFSYQKKSTESQTTQQRDPSRDQSGLLLSQLRSPFVFMIYLHILPQG